MSSDRAIRSIHVAGTLRFDPDRDTRLDVGLIKIQAGDDASENGFDCDAHMPEADAGMRPGRRWRSARPNGPIPAGHTALIRLVADRGHGPGDLPGDRLLRRPDGLPRRARWAGPGSKLGRTARAGEAAVTLAEPVPGWRAGDRVIVTATQRQRRERGTLRPAPGKDPIKAFTEERTDPARSTATSSRSTARSSSTTSARGTIAARSPT